MEWKRFHTLQNPLLMPYIIFTAFGSEIETSSGAILTIGPVNMDRVSKNNSVWISVFLVAKNIYQAFYEGLVAGIQIFQLIIGIQARVWKRMPKKDQVCQTRGVWSVYIQSIRQDRELEEEVKEWLDRKDNLRYWKYNPRTLRRWIASTRFHSQVRLTI